MLFFYFFCLSVLSHSLCSLSFSVLSFSLTFSLTLKSLYTLKRWRTADRSSLIGIFLPFSLVEMPFFSAKIRSSPINKSSMYFAVYSGLASSGSSISSSSSSSISSSSNSPSSNSLNARVAFGALNGGVSISSSSFSFSGNSNGGNDFGNGGNGGDSSGDIGNAGDIGNSVGAFA